MYGCDAQSPPPSPKSGPSTQPTSAHKRRIQRKRSYLLRLCSDNFAQLFQTAEAAQPTCSPNSRRSLSQFTHPHPSENSTSSAMAFVSSVPVANRPFAGTALSSATTTRRRPSPAALRTRMAAASADEMVPDMAKRNTLNVILGGSVTAVALGVLYPFTYFFVPKSSTGGASGTIAKDALGNDIKKEEYLNTHFANSRDLVQGLRGDATYLIVNEDKSDLEFFALNAVCTHLGCVVPWIRAENKFKCPCHGSQYSPTGAVTRGPAPLPLALEHVEVDESDNVVLKSWKEEDFRTGTDPWWNF